MNSFYIFPRNCQAVAIYMEQCRASYCVEIYRGLKIIFTFPPFQILIITFISKIPSVFFPLIGKEKHAKQNSEPPLSSHLHSQSFLLQFSSHIVSSTPLRISTKNQCQSIQKKTMEMQKNTLHKTNKNQQSLNNLYMDCLLQNIQYSQQCTQLKNYMGIQIEDKCKIRIFSVLTQIAPSCVSNVHIRAGDCGVPQWSVQATKGTRRKSL